ncbi:IS30 family transposase [Staphylococcus nepalensis]|uniref:IS30 family transposase n=1 Tax=Staphylococcus nepalensis TaxID=214473 RepID=UPI0024BAF522|nr:IS30 family transposase [Staphylococcus nepalensis]
MKNKHLSYDDRLIIEKGLKDNKSFKEIAKEINKNCTTISREIKNHYVIENKGVYGRAFNNCQHRKTCPVKSKSCSKKLCENYTEESCRLLQKAPYVCNGCKNKNSCTLTKFLYKAEYAQNEYFDNLKESRCRITYSEEELNHLEEILYPLIVNNKQSIHNIYVNNKDKIMCSEKEIYNLIDMGILRIKNIDLPRKVRYRNRKKKKTTYKVDKNCLERRRYSDYLEYIENHPDTPVVEMDTVEGNKGGKVLLTLHFVSCSFMLSYIRNNNDSQSVIDTFNRIQEKIGLEKFKTLFPIILTDNGSEFSNPQKIEYDSDGNQRTRIFYCEPGRPDQKGSCEVNHEMIRKIVKQGESFDNYTQQDIHLMMSHINSYSRKRLNDKSPIDLFNFLYGNGTSQLFSIMEIEPNKVTLSKSIFK